MFTPHGKGWTRLSTPALAPADQQIGGAAVASLTYGKGRAVPGRITELEKELHQYQHNMGLLLIDKQEMVAKYDQFSQAYAQSEEILKREQAAHLNVISEYQKREENIRTALYVEKLRGADLEKELRGMRSEIAGVKFLSQKKIGNVQSLQANIDKKSFLIEKKLNAADAKLAEANLTVSHVDKKIKEIEVHQCRYEKEKLCYETEWKEQENQLKNREESLHEWEKRLKESQNRQVNMQRSLIGREEKVNENGKILKLKQEELQEAEQTVENTNVALKVEECDINNRLHTLHAYEMDIKSKYKTLEKKEEILDVWEERINMKEKKLTEDQKACQESGIQDFELVTKRERESLSEEMQKRITNLQWRENDVKSKEGDLLKSEQELNWNTQMLDNWKHGLDSRSQALKKLEEALEIDDKRVTETILLLENERNDIDRYKLDLERTMSSIEAEKQSSLKEQEILKLAKEDRDQHNMMLVQLKQETEECRVESNSLFKEADDLRQQKLKLERAWEDLDMKKAYTEEAAKKLSYERTSMESFHDSEKRRLKDAKLDAGAKYKKLMEDIRLKEEALMRNIEQQKLHNNQLLEGERADIQRSFDLHRHKLETEMEQKYVNREQELEFEQSELNKKLVLVENEIRSAVKLNGSKIQKIIFEKKELENEKNALVKDQLKLETDKADIKEDIDSLIMLSKRLKDRREAYKKEKNHLISLIDKYKDCKTCGVPVFDELDVAGIKDSTGIEEDDHSLNTEALPQGIGGNGNGYSDTPKGGLHSERLNQGERQQNMEGRLRSVRRTRTMQAVIEEAKMLIGPISEEKHNDQEDYVTASTGQKRALSFLSGGTTMEQCVENTEVYSDGDPSGEPRRKRKQLGDTEMQLQGENRYNLRRNRAANAATSYKTRSGKTRAVKVRSKREVEASGGDHAKGASACGVPSVQISAESGEAKVHESSHMILLTEPMEAPTPVGNTSKRQHHEWRTYRTRFRALDTLRQ